MLCFLATDFLDTLCRDESHPCVIPV
jgi:hypothetical protein